MISNSSKVDERGSNGRSEGYCLSGGIKIIRTFPVFASRPSGRNIVAVGLAEVVT